LITCIPPKKQPVPLRKRYGPKKQHFMIISMTGFGRSELKSPLGLIRVELKTVNHKYFEMSSRLPGHLNEFEDTIRKVISQEVRRGKINVFISCPDPSSFSSRLSLNEALAKEVFQKIKRLEKVLNLKGGGKNPGVGDGVILKEVLHYPDVLTKDVSYEGRNLFSRELEKAVALAVKNLKTSRIQEGKALEKDIKNRILEMRKSLKLIEKRLPVLAREYKKSLAAKMKEFVKNGNLDQERLTLEVALYVKNSDISEEVTRLKSHMDAMLKTFSESGELGRKIDFIAQEMTRESNTMGAKSSDVAVAGCVIAIKSAIEKIREQAQNVE